MNKKDVAPVQLYKRETKNGISLYLHFRINGRQIRENLNLRLTGDKENDKKTLKAAKCKQAERINELLTGKTGVLLDSPKSGLLVTDFCEKVIEYYIAHKQSSVAQSVKSLLHNLRVLRPCRLCDIDRTFCNELISQLKNNYKDTTTKLRYTLFVTILNWAVRWEYIKDNIAAKVERPKATPTERTYLTETEIKAFANVVPYEHEKTTRDAFIFSFYTGLRYSDIVRLTSKNFEQTPDGLRLSILTQKTKKLISFILPKPAADLIKDRMNDGCIFGIKWEATANYQLKRLAKRAGINKRISFHTARHTFATMLLTKGADLYAISQMLGHSKITTTQIYAKIIDNKKTETANLLNDVL